MFSYINPVSLFNYFKEPNPETAQAAIDFLTRSGTGMTAIAGKAQYVFVATLASALLLYSRAGMDEDERAYSENSTTYTVPVSPLYIFSRFLFCIALLSGFSYINCKGGSYLSNYAISWIQNRT
ncbi:hypothetical protein [Simkania sp.]|uniref:hypothetical protein n=1 Tax=Simkania sp. TaxID=34094 RepID=UPI003B524512